MNMLRRTVLVAGAITLAAVTLAASPLAAAATPKPPAPTVSPLKGYRTVTSLPVALPESTQRNGSVQCPTGTVPLGGGVIVMSTSKLVGVNSSYPFNRGWAADVNNAGDTPTTFQVKVICAVKPAKYAVVQRLGLANPAASHSTVAATCPVGTKPFSGGAASNSESVFINISSTAPAGSRSWQISENNATGTNHLVSVLAVCGSVKGYSVVHGPVVSVPGRSIASLGALCPVGVPTGGGTVIQSSSVGAYLNLTTFGTNGWVSFATNTSAVAFKAGSTVVCAQASQRSQSGVQG